MRRYLTLLVTLVVFVPALAHAQPHLNLKRIIVNWPTIELYFSVGCNGAQAYDMQAQDFRIRDNGEEVLPFSLDCPDPTRRCAMTTALVFDASGSMSGAGNEGAKAAGKAFIERMDGVTDEAAVIWFNSLPTLQQGMTSDKTLLDAAINVIPASGMTATWDAVWMALEHVQAQGANDCRTVIALTDGSDGASTRTPQELIAYAQDHHIRVFTVGLGTSINAAELEMIALLTGGRYYQTPNAALLPMVLQEIATISIMSFQECRITYNANLADGLLHTVEVQLAGFCVGTDMKSKEYRAPKDTTTSVGSEPGLAGPIRLHVWPEPSHGELTVEAVVAAGRPVTLRLTDLLGRSEVLYDGIMPDGLLQLPLSLAGRPSGIWLLTLSSDGTQVVRRITLM